MSLDTETIQAVKTVCFNPADPGNPCAKEIEIPTIQEDISIPGPLDAGKPIDANLAVHFMQNFLNHYEIKFFKNGKDEPGEALDIKHGLTISKEMVSKIINQPDCEGIRLYLCACTEQADPGMHLSLVAVGVDSESKDLNYSDGISIPNNLMPNKTDVATNSIIVEYMPPPPYSFENKANEDYYDQFVLQNWARYGQPESKIA